MELGPEILENETKQIEQEKIDQTEEEPDILESSTEV